MYSGYRRRKEKAACSQKEAKKKKKWLQKLQVTSVGKRHLQGGDHSKLHSRKNGAKREERDVRKTRQKKEKDNRRRQ